MHMVNISVHTYVQIYICMHLYTWSHIWMKPHLIGRKGKEFKILSTEQEEIWRCTRAVKFSSSVYYYDKRLISLRPSCWFFLHHTALHYFEPIRHFLDVHRKMLAVSTQRWFSSCLLTKRTSFPVTYRPFVMRKRTWLMSLGQDPSFRTSGQWSQPQTQQCQRVTFVGKDLF